MKSTQRTRSAALKPLHRPPTKARRTSPSRSRQRVVKRPERRAPVRAVRKAKPAWWAEFHADLRPGLEQDTELMPWLIAETVCAEVEHFLAVVLPDRYAVWLDAKAERCYSGRRQFYKLMQGRGNAARDRLYMFMRHWLASFLHLERPDLFRCLPVSFGNGQRLPAGQHPHSNGTGTPARPLPAPRDWDASRVTRHHRWAWLASLGD